MSSSRRCLEMRVELHHIHNLHEAWHLDEPPTGPPSFNHPESDAHTITAPLAAAISQSDSICFFAASFETSGLVFNLSAATRLLEHYSPSIRS